MSNGGFGGQRSAVPPGLIRGSAPPGVEMLVITHIFLELDK